MSVALPHIPAAILPPGAIGHVMSLDGWQWDDPALEQWTHELLPRAIDRRRIQFAAGRTCAALAVEQLTGVRRHPSAIGRDPAGGPAWPADVVGSVSHCGHLAGAVAMWRTATPGGGIGLDIEPVMTAARLEKVARRILTADEQAGMQACASLTDSEAATLAFSVKEAVFKCLHPLVSRMFFFPDVWVERLELTGAIGDRPVEGRVDVRLTTSLSETMTSDRLFPVAVAVRDGVVYAVASV